jgi:hypothetical protein
LHDASTCYGGGKRGKRQKNQSEEEKAEKEITPFGKFIPSPFLLNLFPSLVL